MTTGDSSTRWPSESVVSGSNKHAKLNTRSHDVSFVGCDVNEYLTSILGPSFADYRKRWTAAEKHFIAPCFPLFVQVETVDGCNLKCKMCYRRLKVQGGVQRMDNGVYGKILKSIDGKCPSICLNGNNEPLLDSCLPDRIAMAHSAGVIDSRINTNGMMLTEDMALQLINSGLTRLSVSVDAATMETYGGIRTGGDFDKVVRNVSNFLEIRNSSRSKLPVLRVTFVLLQSNLHEVDSFCKFWSDKAEYVSFQRYVPHLAEDSNLDLGASLTSKSSSCTCPQPFERLVIDTSGNVYPCCSPLGTQLKLGTVLQYSLKELWDCQMEQQLRKCLGKPGHAKNNVCSMCLGAP